MLKFVAFLMISSTLAETTDYEELKKMTSGFLYSMPKALLSGRNESVCLSTHYSSALPIKVMVDLKIKEKHFLTNKFLDSEYSCFELNVPHYLKEPQLASIRVQVQLNGIVYSAHNQDPVIIYPNKKITFIETDRGTYKSEDKIKIRILSISDDLLPEHNYKVPQILIRNPSGVNVVVWQNVSTEFGLAHLEHQLSRDPVEGKWQIEADGNTKTFEVRKYVLPRFKISLIYPKTIYHKTPSVNMKVCARYGHGGSVRGTAFLRLTDSTYNVKTVQDLKKMINGCAEFTYTNAELSLYDLEKTFPMIDPRITLHITATVTEHGTDKIELKTAKALVSLNAYKMKLATDKVFLPGLPYHGAIELTDVNTDIRGEVIEICYNIAIKKSWNYLNNQQCSNFTAGNENLIKFHILPLKNSVIHLQVSARSLNHTNIGDTFLVVRLYSASSTYIMLDQIQSVEKTKCRSNQQFTAQYTADRLKENENITFYYMIKSRGHIHKLGKITHNVFKHYPNYSEEYTNIIGTKHKHIKSSSAIGKFILKFKLDGNIVSNYHLLLYFITDAGEVVSATKMVEIEPCLTNKVEANWSHRQIAPGSTASLLVQTKSESLCSILATDKAVRFMNDVRLLDIRSFLAPFLQEKEIPESGRKSCVPPVKKSRDAANLMEAETDWDLKRRKRYVYPFSEDYDAYDLFNKFGTITITNFKVVTKPCYTGPVPSPNDPVQFLVDQYEAQNEDNVTPVRSFFPETWLWELIPVRGASVIHRTLPHTITSWETNVLCVSGTDGVGFSKNIDITTYQPFFVDVVTPYSIKKGETLYLNVVVFNHLSYNIPIRITLVTSDGLKVMNSFKGRSLSYCVSNNNTVTHIFEIKGLKIGNMNITVVAEIDSVYPRHCGPDIVVNKRDVVLKSLFVEPEGYPFKETKSVLLCASGIETPNNVTWDFKIPENIVPRTSKTNIILNGDILGQTIENLEELIVMPTGCGEQIMATMAPNIYILRYLNATNNITPSIRHRIIRNLKIGYQRILNYVHKDGSFSPFGYHDPTGSMFLTAFVMRTLQEAKEHIYVDQRIIDRAIFWILNHQLENGCFNTMFHVFQDMGNTDTENSTAALTAYVMISLLDSKVEVPENVKTNAKYCIRGHHHLDKYTLAISSYALLKVNWYNEAHRMLKRLFQISHQKDNMMWWSNKDSDGSTASDIEITSYVLLALLHERTQENLAKAHSIVRWLSSKKGPQGGFRSTQDTVVALNALTKYNNFLGANQINIDVALSAYDQMHQFKIRNEDRLKSKKIVLKRADNQVTINVQGEGCILAQALTSYYLKQRPSSDAFKLDMEIHPVSNIDQCSIATLSPCFIYNGPDTQANMAILEVELPSGYQADRASLYKLIDEDTSTKVKMFEEVHQKVILYFTKLDTQQICINFNINENAIVHSRSESTVKLYDYYKPEYTVLQLYQINDKCKFNNLSIPTISKNNTNNPSEDVKNVVKRNSGVNPESANMDFELVIPEGVEGNSPVYVKSNSSISTVNSVNQPSFRETWEKIAKNIKLIR